MTTTASALGQATFAGYNALVGQQLSQQAQLAAYGYGTTANWDLAYQAYPMPPSVAKKDHFFWRVNEEVGYSDYDVIDSPVDRLRIRAKRWLEGGK